MTLKLTKKDVALFLVALLVASLINMVPATLIQGEYSPAAARVFSQSLPVSDPQVTSEK